MKVRMPLPKWFISIWKRFISFLKRFYFNSETVYFNFETVYFNFEMLPKSFRKYGSHAYMPFSAQFSARVANIPISVARRKNSFGIFQSEFPNLRST